MTEIKKVDLIIDLQYGSTGKGSLVGLLAYSGEYDTTIANPNTSSGHTCVCDKGTFIHKALPLGIVGDSVKTVMIGPGSVINIDVLEKEYNNAKELMGSKRLMIHPNALIVTQYHILTEQQILGHIGSTCTGGGAARVSKIWRDAKELPIAKFELGSDHKWVCTHDEWRDSIARSKRILIESSQGTSLSIDSKFYPCVTSRNVSTAGILSDCAVPIKMLDQVFGTVRTYPIRVAGTSGGCYDDQHEVSWEEIGQEKEYTTVTKKVRRVFTFSEKQIEEAIFENSVDSIFLNFCNYMGKKEVAEMVKIIESNKVRVKWQGWGAHVDDIYES